MSYISKETLFNSREYLNQRTKKTDTLIGLNCFFILCSRAERTGALSFVRYERICSCCR